MKSLNLFCNDSDKNAFEGFAQNTNWADLFGKSLSARIQIPNAVKTLSLFSGAGGKNFKYLDFLMAKYKGEEIPSLKAKLKDRDA